MRKIIFVNIPDLEASKYSSVENSSVIKVSTKSPSLEDVVRAFGDFLKASGYHSDSVDQYLDQEEYECRKALEEREKEDEIERRVNERLESMGKKRKLPPTPDFLK